MKKLLLLLLIAPALFFSCDKIEEANTITFDETISLNIPVTVDAPTAIVVKSTAEHTFTATETASIGDISDELSKYLSKIKSIEATNLEIVFGNLAADEEIKKIDIFVSGVNQAIVTLENITSSNNTHMVEKAKLIAVGTLLNSTKSVSITVSGTTSKAPMDFTVDMDFDCHIEAKAL